MAKKKDTTNRRTTIRREGKNSGKLLRYDRNNPRDNARTSIKRGRRTFELLRSRNVKNLRTTKSEYSWNFPMDIIDNNDYTYVHSSVRNFQKAIRNTGLVNTIIKEIGDYSSQVSEQILALKKRDYSPEKEQRIKNAKFTFDGKTYNLLEFYSGQANAPVIQALQKLKDFLNLYKEIRTTAPIGYNKSAQQYTYTLKADNVGIEEEEPIYFDAKNNEAGRKAVIDNIKNRLMESINLDEGTATETAQIAVSAMENAKLTNTKKDKNEALQPIYKQMNAVIKSKDSSVQTVLKDAEEILKTMGYVKNATSKTLQRVCDKLKDLDNLQTYVWRSHIDFGTLFELFRAEGRDETERVGMMNSKASTSDLVHTETLLETADKLTDRIGESLKFYTSKNLGLEVKYSSTDMQSIFNFSKNLFKHMKYFILNYAFISDYQMSGKSDISENYLVNNDVYAIYAAIESLMQKMLFASGIIAAFAKNNIDMTKDDIPVPYILTVNNKSVYIWDIYNKLAEYIENGAVGEEIEFNITANKTDYSDLIKIKRKALETATSYTELINDQEVVSKLQEISSKAFGRNGKGKSIAKTKIYIDMARIMEEQTGTKAV